MDVMSLCNSRATWAAVGGGDGYGIPASSATVHRRIVDDRAWRSSRAPNSCEKGRSRGWAGAGS